MLGSDDTSEPVLRRAVQWVDHRIRSQSLARSRPMLIISALIFVGVTSIAVANLPELERGLSWGYLAAVALIGVPLTIALNSMEFIVSGQIAGHRVRHGDALRVALVGSAANNLPIPGAATVRVAWLRRSGRTYGQALSATLVMGFAWLGTTAVLAGTAQLINDWSLFGTLLVAGGAIILAVDAVALWRLVRDPRRRGAIALKVLSVEVGFVLVLTLRYWLTLSAIGVDATMSQAIALSLSVVLASAIGIFPGGLGLREVIAAGISPLVSLPASVGLLATAIDRLVALAMMTLLTIALAIVTNSGNRSPEGFEASLTKEAIPPESKDHG